MDNTYDYSALWDEIAEDVESGLTDRLNKIDFEGIIKKALSRYHLKMEDIDWDSKAFQLALSKGLYEAINGVKKQVKADLGDFDIANYMKISPDALNAKIKTTFKNMTETLKEYGKEAAQEFTDEFFQAMTVARVRKIKLPDKVKEKWEDAYNDLMDELRIGLGGKDTGEYKIGSDLDAKYTKASQTYQEWYIAIQDRIEEYKSTVEIAKKVVNTIRQTLPKNASEDQVRDVVNGLLESSGSGIAKTQQSLKELDETVKELGDEVTDQHISDAYKELFEEIKKVGNVAGLDVTNEKLRKSLEELKLIGKEAENLTLVNQGYTNEGGIIGEDKVVLLRKNTEENLQNSQELMGKLEEAYKRGVNVARIIDVINDGSKVFMEVQEKMSGKTLGNHVDVINWDFLDATEEQINRFAEDIKKLQDLSVGVDINLSNIFYDKDKGFGFIDLDLQPAMYEGLEDFLHDARGGIVGEIEDECAEMNKDLEKIPLAENFFNKFAEGFKGSLNVHSPSKETAKIADNVVDGFVEEIEERLPEVEKAGEKLGDAIKEGIKSSVQDVSKVVDNNIDTIRQKITQDYDNKIAQQPQHKAELERLRDARMAALNNEILPTKKDIGDAFLANFADSLENMAEIKDLEFANVLWDNIIKQVHKALKVNAPTSEADYSGMLDEAIKVPFNKALDNVLSNLVEAGKLNENGELTSIKAFRESILTVFDFFENNGIQISGDSRMGKYTNRSSEEIINNARQLAAENIEMSESYDAVINKEEEFVEQTRAAQTAVKDFDDELEAMMAAMDAKVGLNLGNEIKEVDEQVEKLGEDFGNIAAEPDNVIPEWAEQEAEKVVKDFEEMHQEAEKTEKAMSRVMEIWKEFGTPSDALDAGRFERVQEALDYLGGKFAEMNTEADDFSEHKLNAAFYKELIKELDLTEDQLTVVKGLIEDIYTLAPGGRFAHLYTPANASKFIFGELDKIRGILNGEYQITDKDLKDAKIVLESIQSSVEETTQTEVQMGKQGEVATEQITEGLKEVQEEAEKTVESLQQVGDKLSIVGYHGTAKKWKGDAFDVNQTRAAQLGSGMYFVDSPEKLEGFLSRPGSGDIKKTELNLERCFMLTKDYISSIEDINKILGTTFDETTESKEVINAIRNFTKASKANSLSFRQSMLDLGYQGLYAGDNLANKKIDSELVVYDESLLQNLETINKADFQSLLNNVDDVTQAEVQMGEQGEAAAKKVTDAVENMRRVFHGSKEDFGDVFDVTKGSGKVFGAGGYFTEDVNFAKSYGNIISEWFANVKNVFQEESKLSEEELHKVFDEYYDTIQKIAQMPKMRDLKDFDVSTFEGFAEAMAKTINPTQYVLQYLAKEHHGGTSTDIFKMLGYDAYENKQRHILNVFDSENIVRADQVEQSVETLKATIEETSQAEKQYQSGLKETTDEIQALINQYKELKATLYDKNFKFNEDAWKQMVPISNQLYERGYAFNSITEEWDEAAKVQQAQAERTAKLKKEIAEYNKAHPEHEEELEKIRQKNQELEEQKQKIAELEQQNELLNQSVKDQAQQLADITTEYSNVTEEAKKTNVALEEQKQQIAELEGQNESLRSSLQAQGDELQHAYEEQGSLQMDLDSAESTSKILEDDLNKQKQITAELEAQVESEKQLRKEAESNAKFYEEMSHMAAGGEASADERARQEAEARIEAEKTLKSEQDKLALIEQENQALKEQANIQQEKLNLAEKERAYYEEAANNGEREITNLENQLKQKQAQDETLNKQVSELDEKNKALTEVNQNLQKELQLEKEVNAQKTSSSAKVGKKEVDNVDKLTDALRKVIDAVNEKTEAFKKEQSVVKEVVKSEVGDVAALKGAVDDVSKARKTNQQNKQQQAKNTENEKIKEVLKYYEQLEKTEQRYQYLIAKRDISNKDLSVQEAMQLQKLQMQRDLEQERLLTLKEITKEVRAAQESYKHIAEMENQNASGATRNALVKSIENQISKTQAKIDSGKYTQLSSNAVQTRLNNVKNANFDEANVEQLQTYVQLLEEMNKQFVKAGNNTKLTNLLGEVNQILADNSKLSRGLRTQFADLGTQLESALATGSSQEEVQALTRRLIELKTEMIKTGQNGKSFFGMVKNDITQASARVIATYMSFQDLIRYTRQAISAITDLNTALTQLKIVSGESDTTIKAVAQDAYNLANKLGMSTTEVVSSITEWRRLGKSIEDSMILAEQAARLSTGGLMDISSATTALTSSMQAFEMGAEDASRVVDQYIYLGKQLPIDNYIG